MIIEEERYKKGRLRDEMGEDIAMDRPREKKFDYVSEEDDAIVNKQLLL